MKARYFYIALASFLILPIYSLGASVLFDRCFQNCAVDDSGYTLIKGFEGFSPFIYKDTAGVPTVGFGHALQPHEEIKTPLMGPDALELLQKDVNDRVPEINRMLKVPLAAPQFDALASFGYNVGIASLKRSTLLKRVNAGRQGEAHPQFLLWDKAGGVESYGLHLRREAEATLFDRGIE